MSTNAIGLAVFLNTSNFTKTYPFVVLLNFADNILTVIDVKRLKVNISTFKGVKNESKTISRYELSKNSEAGPRNFRATIIIAKSNCTGRPLL